MVFNNRFFVTKKSVFCIENIYSWKNQFRLFWKHVYLACERLKYAIQGEIPASHTANCYCFLQSERFTAFEGNNSSCQQSPLSSCYKTLRDKVSVNKTFLKSKAANSGLAKMYRTTLHQDLSLSLDRPVKMQVPLSLL